MFQRIKAELKQWLVGQCCCEVTTVILHFLALVLWMYSRQAIYI